MPYTREPRLASAGIPQHAETVLRTDGSRVEMRLWQGARGLAYLIEYRQGAQRLLCYEGDTREATRTRHGRAVPYAFRSIEQLRYDFEREFEEINDGGEAPA
jgi:hypothetical protein